MVKAVRNEPDYPHVTVQFKGMHKRMRRKLKKVDVGLGG